MNTTTTATKVSAMAATVGAALLLQAFSGLPLVFALLGVIGAVSLLFGATVIAMALVMAPREPVTMRRSRLRATA